jgi:hypothetical protein
MKKTFFTILAGLSLTSCTSFYVSLNQKPYENGQVGVVSYKMSILNSTNKKRRDLAMKYAKSVCNNASLVREYNSTEKEVLGANTRRAYDGSYQTNVQSETVFLRVIEFRCR